MLLKITVTVPTPAQLKKAVQRAALKQMMDKLRGIRCPEHNGVPRLVVRAGKYDLFRPCCDALQEQVNRAVGK
jgi:hypothetical protein